MENSCFRKDNKLRKDNHFSTETLIYGHKGSNRRHISTSSFVQTAAKRAQFESTEKLHTTVAPLLFTVSCLLYSV